MSASQSSQSDSISQSFAYKCEYETLWVKFGQLTDICCVGRDVLCLGRGCHLLFYNVVTKEELFYRASTESRGDGLSCFCGHRVLPLLAFAEKCTNTRIIIMAYPYFEHVMKLVDGSMFGYEHIAFSETEYLVSLTSIPNFSVIVWLWRTGEKLAVHDSHLLFSDQILSYSTSTLFAQAATNTRFAKIWDLHVCAKKCMLSQKHVKLPKGKEGLVGLLWYSNDTVLLMDSLANVYQVSCEDYVAKMVIKWTLGTGPIVPCFKIYKGGLVISGPNKTIAYYKKSHFTKWDCISSFTTEYGVVKIIGFKESLLGWSTLGYILSIDIEAQVVKMVHYYEFNYIDYCIVHPACDFLVTLNVNYELSTWMIATGIHISTISLITKSYCIRGHPFMPLVIVGRADGALLIVSVFIITKPTPIQYIRLTTVPIQQLKFSDSAKHLIAGNNTEGIYFILRASENSHEWTVMKYIDLHYQMADFQLLENRDHVEALFIKVTSKKFIIGNRLISCTFDKNQFDETGKFVLEMPRRYASIHISYRKEDDENIIFGVPHMSKQLHVLQLSHLQKTVVVVDRFQTGHQMRLFWMRSKRNYMMSLGVDGLIIVNNVDMTESYGIIMPHHRLNGGVIKADFDPITNRVVSLGRGLSLVCTKLLTAPVNDEELLKNERKKLFTPTFYNMCNVVFTGNPRNIKVDTAFIDSTDFTCNTDIDILDIATTSKQTWLEMEQEALVMRECIQCAVPRKEILDDLQVIKNRIKDLLDNNEQAPPEEKLEIQEFNLDLDWIESRKSDTQRECDRVKIYLENLIKAQDKITDHIKKICWDIMHVKHRTLRALFANYEVENYCMLPNNQQEEYAITVLKERRRHELLLSKDDIFTPWIPISDSALETFLKHEPSVNAEDEAVRIKEAMAMDEAADEVGAELAASEIDEQHRFFYGTISHTFIDTMRIPRFTQFEVQTFFQHFFEREIKKYNALELRKFFNKQFDDVFALKTRELQLLYERNGRFRHILSELKNNEIYVNDPEIRMTENPEKIITVTDQEVTIAPYISPSEQAILDAQAAEAERIRLLLLADDFRERALIYMMDGVLEIRWEDEIKKDVPKPACMIEKDPKDYTEEDLRAIMDYDEKVRFLMSERERYRKMLEAEYAKLAGNYRDSIKKFNNRLADLFLLKLKIESAMLQERFKIARQRQTRYIRKMSFDQEQTTLSSMSDNIKEVEQLQKDIVQLNSALNDCRGVYESLLNKERMMDKIQKKDFPEASPLLLDQYTKLFKRRPKYVVKSNSPTLYYELAKCVTSSERPMFLPNESLEYLKSLEALDTMANVPETIQEANYNKLTIIRRTKIEMELKLKGMSYEILEAEATIAFFTQLLQHKREIYDSLETKLQNIRQKTLADSQNMTMQLVLKSGLVEIPLTGNISDFDDAVLINRSKVEQINSTIQKNGQRKLAAMNAAMTFRRSILQKEWEHRHMVMEIEDLEQYMRTMNRVKVGREVISYLKLKANDQPLDKGMQSLDKEVEQIRESYLRMISEREAAVQEIEERITAKKRDTAHLNHKIMKLNVDVCEKELERNRDFEVAYDQSFKIRMQSMIKRSRLIKTIQNQYNEIITLQTELELLRLKTYPTLKYNPFHS